MGLGQYYPTDPSTNIHPRNGTLTKTRTKTQYGASNRIEAREHDAPRKMKVRASVKRLCSFCKVVKRRGIVFIHCKSNLKHKQRQGFSTIAACLPPPPPTGTSASAVAFAEASKVARQESSMKFNWPLGLAALLKNGDK
ncbi:hypothetical protein ACQ4PT_002155 [Festuca glaucescens]